MQYMMGKNKTLHKTPRFPAWESKRAVFYGLCVILRWLCSLLKDSNSNNNAC